QPLSGSDVRRSLQLGHPLCAHSARLDRCEVYSTSVTRLSEPNVPSANTTRLLDLLDELKNQFDSNIARRVELLLDELSRKSFDDTDPLVRYHELLLFLRAYPHNASTLRLTEKELGSFSKRVERFRELEI